MLALKTEGLSKLYWIDEGIKGKSKIPKWAIRQIDLEIEQGDCVALIGKNGSGKSTLLKILSRIIHPTEGRFCINGKLVSLLELGVGFHPDLSGRENIFLKGTLLGMSHREIRQKMEAITDFSELGAHIDMQVKRYSSGMYMRLAFAIAAHCNSDILMIDEALAVGDISFQQKCFRKMNEIRLQKGRTIIIVNHNMEGVQAICNKSIWLEQGELVAMGAPADVAVQYFAKSIENELATLQQGEGKYGNGKASVQSVTFTDKDGHVLKELHCGAPLNITFHLCLTEHIQLNHLVLACAFGLSFGQYTLIWHSGETNAFPLSNKFTLSIPALELRPGVYYFSYRLGIGNLEAENVSDAHENAFALTVSDPDLRRLSFPSCIGRGDFA